MAVLNPYYRTYWRGYLLNRRTIAMLKWVEKRTGLRLELAQGSYNAGGVSASGGTHDRGGAVDLRTRQYTDQERRLVLRALKDAGFAAWYRPEVPGLWGPHIHAIAIKDKELSGQAAAQVLSYDAGRDGLRGNREDNTYRPNPRVKWSYLLGKPVRR